MEAIRTFPKGTGEYDRLSMLAALLTNHSPNGWKYYVGTTYFDFGQDWKWTTVLCDNGKVSYQALCPSEQALAINTEDFNAFVGLVVDVFEGRHCPDKKE